MKLLSDVTSCNLILIKLSAHTTHGLWLGAGPSRPLGHSVFFKFFVVSLICFYIPGLLDILNALNFFFIFHSLLFSCLS